MGSREPVMSLRSTFDMHTTPFTMQYCCHMPIIIQCAVCTISDEYKMLSTSENMLHAEQYSEHEVLDR